MPKRDEITCPVVHPLQDRILILMLPRAYVFKTKQIRTKYPGIKEMYMQSVKG